MRNHNKLKKICKAQNRVDELLAVLKKVHPWSSLHYGLSATDVVKKLYLEWIPKYFGNDIEIQIITPMTRGSLGTVSLNRMIQEFANPPQRGKAQLQVGERIFRVGDRVIHRRNNYDLGVFNGDIGIIQEIDSEELTCVVSFFPDKRRVEYKREDISELDLSYAITIHKSQGSEYPAVVIPILSQHYIMLQRNLLYTAITRAKRLVVLVGSKRAIAIAIRNNKVQLRYTNLSQRLRMPG